MVLIGYMRASKAGGGQVTDLQLDALVEASDGADQLYEDRAPRKRDGRPTLDACLRALRERDTRVVWKLDRLGRNLKHLVEVVQALDGRGVGLKGLTGQAASIDTTTTTFFAALVKSERERIVGRTVAGLAAARARATRRRGIQNDPRQAPARASGNGKAADEARGAMRRIRDYTANALQTCHTGQTDHAGRRQAAGK